MLTVIVTYESVFRLGKNKKKDCYNVDHIDAVPVTKLCATRLEPKLEIVCQPAC